jgi:isopenicillin N synthase-like dioxygenase
MYTSSVRYVVTLSAGLILTQGLRLGVHLDQGAVTMVVQAAVTGLYYNVFRWAETHLGQGWGWFLGLARPPQYADVPPGKLRGWVRRRVGRRGGGTA